jgi:hypothetical protein
VTASPLATSVCAVCGTAAVTFSSSSRLLKAAHTHSDATVDWLVTWGNPVGGFVTPSQSSLPRRALRRLARVGRLIRLHTQTNARPCKHIQRTIVRIALW